MRRFFPLVLMLLLVLRGLVGTAMAAGMVATLPAGEPVQQAHSMQQPPLHLSHASEDGVAAETADLVAMAEHSMGMQNDSFGDGSHAPCSDPSASPCGQAEHTHSPLCQACEICHSALLVPSQLNALPHPGGPEVRPAPTAMFASAAAALAIKPPIA